MIKVIELFAGIGAWKKALTNLGIENSTMPVEIDKDTYNAYISIHGEKIAFNDCNSSEDIKIVSQLNWNPNNKYDLLVMSPPCQGFSNAKQNGGGIDKDRDNLITYTLPIIKQTMPRYVIVENVPNFQKSEQYIKFAKQMWNLKYENQGNILNSLDYNWPQNRKRFFEIWFRDYKDFTNYEWPKKEKLTKSLGNIIAPVVNQNFKHIWKQLPDNAKERKNGNGYIWGDYIDNRCYKWDGYVGTITATFNQPWILGVDDCSIRKLTPLESGLLMGFTQDDHNNIINSNPKLSNTKIKKMYGNSIVVPLIEKIIKGLDFNGNNN